MNVVVIGGGPAGAVFARAAPRASHRRRRRAHGHGAREGELSRAFTWASRCFRRRLHALEAIGVLPADARALPGEARGAVLRRRRLEQRRRAQERPLLLRRRLRSRSSPTRSRSRATSSTSCSSSAPPPWAPTFARAGPSPRRSAATDGGALIGVDATRSRRARRTGSSPISSSTPPAATRSSPAPSAPPAASRGSTAPRSTLTTRASRATKGTATATFASSSSTAAGSGSSPSATAAPASGWSSRARRCAPAARPASTSTASSARCWPPRPTTARLLEGARQLWPAQATADFSYRCERMHGPGWLAVGDAGGFIDPLFSTGVHLAVQGAFLAADAVGECRRRSGAGAGTCGLGSPGSPRRRALPHGGPGVLRRQAAPLHVRLQPADVPSSGDHLHAGGRCLRWRGALGPGHEDPPGRASGSRRARRVVHFHPCQGG